MKRRWATGRGRAGHTGTSATCMIVRGTLAIEYHRQHLVAIAKEVCEGMAYGKLGNAYQSIIKMRWDGAKEPLGPTLERKTLCSKSV